jgi:hypothetical protein
MPSLRARRVMFHVAVLFIAFALRAPLRLLTFIQFQAKRSH